MIGVELLFHCVEIVVGIRSLAPGQRRDELQVVPDHSELCLGGIHCGESSKLALNHLTRLFWKIGLIELGFAQIKDELEEDCEARMDSAGWDAAKKDSKRAIELNNGRAAQMGILALMVHEKLDNNPYIINSLLGAPVDFNAGF